MIELSIAIWISVGWFVYYLAFQVFSDFIRAGSAYNTPNKQIAKLRTEYKVNIRTFQKNNNLLGFAWFKSIWINENLFRKPMLMFVFFHEYYHLKHHHKQWVLFIRLVIVLEWLLLSIMHWSIVACIIFGSVLIAHYIKEKFEDQANDYAKKMTSDDVDGRKESGHNK